jgi:hypothetical protein
VVQGKQMCKVKVTMHLQQAVLLLLLFASKKRLNLHASLQIHSLQQKLAAV